MKQDQVYQHVYIGSDRKRESLELLLCGEKTLGRKQSQSFRFIVFQKDLKIIYKEYFSSIILGKAYRIISKTLSYC